MNTACALSRLLTLVTDQISRRFSEVGIDSSHSDGVNLYGARATGAAPETKSIWNSTCRVGGNPEKSSGKTSEKSSKISTSSSRFYSDLSSVSFFITCAKKV
ncbi:hypothetical protein Tco_0202171 [Tanacetum coccineum]